MRGAVATSCLLVACSFQPGVLPRPSDASATADDAPRDSASDAPLDSARCPADFVTVPATSSVYKAIITPATYTGAVGVCSGLGANVRLARLDNQAETDALYTFMDDAVTVGDTNITRVVGQRHANGVGTADDSWHDLDDVTLLPFLPWGANEPTSLVGENCMSLRDEFGASNARVTGADDCITARTFACECEP